MVGKSCQVGAPYPKKPLRGWFAKSGSVVRADLIGGLGMGYTVRAALDAASPYSRVFVSELVPAVIDWNRGPLASLARHPLEDRRVAVRSGSVIDILSASQHCFDGIILDVDNGPEAVLYQPNRFLYSAEGLELVKGALGVDGTLGVWSADH